MGAADRAIFTAADPDVFDVPWAEHWPDSTPRLLPADLALPPGWQRRVSGPWTVVYGGEPLPPSGWKIHIAALPSRAPAVAQLVLAHCLRHGVPLKVHSTTRLVALSLSKYAPTHGVGKIIVAYPQNLDVCDRLLADLRATLAGEPGARPRGDVPIADAPIGIRYGSFAQVWATAADGRPVPGIAKPAGIEQDDRTSGMPPGVGLPPCFRPHVLAPGPDRLPISDVSVLHRTAAGAVYRATWGGRQVVVKQAHRHCGLDLDEADACERLRHEWEVLQRCAGLGVTAEPLDYVTLADDEFLVMSALPGTTLARAMVARHPGVRPAEDPTAGRSYLTWVKQSVDQVTAAVLALHERGVCHGDLHPDNILIDDARVWLVDLESAQLDGSGPGRGVTTAVFTGGDRGGAADLCAIRRLDAVLTNPCAAVLARRPDLAGELRSAVLADFGVVGSRERSGQPRPSHEQIDVDRLVRGIHAVASPLRRDRLFPGDIRQADGPRGGLGLAYGAAGVLLALQGAGRHVPGEWVSWLAGRALEPGPWPRGLATGCDGVALAAALLGRDDVSRRIIGQWHGRELGVPVAPWWDNGRAGLAVAAAELAVLLDSPDLLDAALDHAAFAADALRRPGVPPGYEPGLLHGWAGVALALQRVCQIVAHSRGPEASGVSELAQASRAAIEREIGHCRVEEGALLAVAGPRSMPYLAVGSAALGLAVAAQPDDHPIDNAATVLAGVRAALGVGLVMEAGLWHGRAGLLATQQRLGAGDVASAARHRHRLRWTLLPGDHLTRPVGDAHPGTFDLVLGEGLTRASADLATGSAGVLLTRAPGDPLAHVLRLPLTASAPMTWNRSAGTVVGSTGIEPAIEPAIAPAIESAIETATSRQ